jgi:hypothetical protein
VLAQARKPKYRQRTGAIDNQHTPGPISHHAAFFRRHSVPELVHHGRLHRFKDDYRSLTDLPKVRRFTEVSHAPLFLYEERAVFGLLQVMRQLGTELDPLAVGYTEVVSRTFSELCKIHAICEFFMRSAAA